jgi:hypothetical protein
MPLSGMRFTNRQAVRCLSWTLAWQGRRCRGADRQAAEREKERAVAAERDRQEAVATPPALPCGPPQARISSCRAEVFCGPGWGTVWDNVGA